MAKPPSTNPVCRALPLAWALALCTGLGGAHAEPRRSGLFEAETERYAATRTAIQNGQWRAALDALTQQSSIYPGIQQEAEFHNLMGYVLRQSDVRQLPLAITHYHKALAIDPAHVQAREYLGQAHLLQGRFDLAEQELQEIERHCGNRSCEAWQDLAEAIAAARAQPQGAKPTPSAQP